MSLTPGPLTFSHARLRKVWGEYRPVHGSVPHDHYRAFDLDSSHNLQHPHAARHFCLKLYSSVQDPIHHLNKLDSNFDAINLRPFLKTALSENLVIEKAHGLLSQLPATAPDILDALPFGVPPLQEYQHQSVDLEATSVTTQVHRWTRLRVVHHVNTFLLRFALHVAVVELEAEDRKHGFDSGPVTDSMLVLLRLSLQLSAQEGMPDAQWVIVCAFLWTSWQRSLMIHLWSWMSLQLRGFNPESNSALARKELNLIPEIFKSRSQQHLEELRQIPYLCGWAFRSLRNDRANIAMDLRHFHDCYRAHFGRRPAACNQGPTQCDGGSSHDCKRFSNTAAENQSMHDDKCDGTCQRLFWSRESFISVPGAKAVDIASTESNNLQYCKVSECTLAVSHVWSHGQGGRPDDIGLEGTGFNLCLHRRYADLAASLGCNSYWMDTSCIPSEKALRRECVAQINGIFATSGKTVICDRDIMAIDISNLTIHAYESILAALLVCDWDIRAWTLLEAMRGRYGLFVLCRHNRLINLRELLKSVHENGRMDLTNLFLARDYLFPPMAISGFELFPGYPIMSEVEREIEKGFVNIGEAAALLSHRHATRDGDDLMIWSLLIGDFEDKSPIAMWERQIGKRIPTGCLVSSAQRVQGQPGLGWAPFSPTALQRIDVQSTGSKAYPASDGSATSDGLITREGLRAKWLTYVFPNVTTSTVAEEKTPDFGLPEPCAEIASQRLRGYKWGALLQAMPCKGPRNIPVAYRGSLGPVVVVCGSRDNDIWEWKGIHGWDAKIALPPFTIEEILIV